ncbi:MAG: chromosomal replication initiator protein DnaA [Ktedonobacteraceae bacterium]|nr:chromosomal replication initiator protein DnaA [Ktedonobacteraceae bacterium]
MNAKQIWQTTIERLQTKVKPEVFTTWFQGTSALSFQDGVFIVRVPTTFARAHLEFRYIDIIHEVLEEVMGGPVEVKFVVSKENPPSLGDEMEETTILPAQKRTYRLPRKRAAQREKRIAEAAAAAMNSIAPPVTPHTSVHRINEQGVQHRDADLYDAYSALDEQPQNQKNEPDVARLFPSEGLLNARYTFNSFIVGKSNQLAHAASLAVSENPGHIYNPLFLYGGVGLGKTHLMHAVGHAGESRGLNVLYVTSEKFTNEIINAIRFQKTEEFRAKYRQIDILLVDDIQFIAGKESTEEEFFHTFNSLHSANKQIVVTSDRPPKAIHSLQDRLRSRFEWGLLADVQPPEYEHRLAILRSKAESLRFAVPSAVIDYIARPECSSVRELEGALNRVIAYATLHDEPLTMNLTVKALEHIYSDKKPSSNLTITQVLEGICAYYHVDIELLRGKQRDRDIVWPRQVAMYLMREETSASLLQIGTALGGRDHTTIMHGWEKVNGEMAHNDRIRQEIATVLTSILGGNG